MKLRYIIQFCAGVLMILLLTRKVSLDIDGHAFLTIWSILILGLGLRFAFISKEWLEKKYVNMPDYYTKIFGHVSKKDIPQYYLFLKIMGIFFALTGLITLVNQLN